MTKEECKQYYDEVVSLLKNETLPDDLDTIKERFEKAQEIHKFENDYIYVITKDRLTKMLIEKFSSFRMNELLEQVLNKKIGFKFIIIFHSITSH